MLNFNTDGLQGYIDQIKSSVTQLSGTGVAVIQARQQLRNALADSRNQDSYNIQIATASSPTPMLENLRQQRDALNAADGKGAQIPGQSNMMMPLLLLGAAAVAWLAFK